jgi:ADP-heptose:LPS heptosyltransferase
MYPDARVVWHVLDPYKYSLGEHAAIDEIVTHPIDPGKGLPGIAARMRELRGKHLNYEQFVWNGSELHINAYFGYLIRRVRDTGAGAIGHELSREPFYLQFYKNAFALRPHEYDASLWRPPEWRPRKEFRAEAESYLHRHGCAGQKIVLVSPFVADKDCQADNTSAVDWAFVHERLKQSGMPTLYTGTMWDTPFLPDGAMNGYAPHLSLGALMYIIRFHSHLMVSLNSGIGFASHWLGCPSIMIDNRIAWRQQVEAWKSSLPNFSGVAEDNEHQWPPFELSRFPRRHLLEVPFSQILWDEQTFVHTLEATLSRIGV